MATVADTVGAAQRHRSFRSTGANADSGCAASGTSESALSAAGGIIAFARRGCNDLERLKRFSGRSTARIAPSLPAVAFRARCFTLYRPGGLAPSPEPLTPERKPLNEPLEATWEFERSRLWTAAFSWKRSRHRFWIGCWRERFLWNIKALNGCIVHSDSPAAIRFAFPSNGCAADGGEAASLTDLVRLKLERLRLPGEVTGVTVRAAVVTPLEFRQEKVFDGCCDGDRGERDR